MRPPLPLFLLIALVLVASVLLVAGCGDDGDGDTTAASDEDRAVAAAKLILSGQAPADLSRGPCISESIPGLPDWVADVAHDPREDVDDDPANQCQRYRNGEADHFVELTPDGELIRAE